MIFEYHPSSDEVRLLSFDVGVLFFPYFGCVVCGFEVDAGLFDLGEIVMLIEFDVILIFLSSCHLKFKVQQYIYIRFLI